MNKMKKVYIDTLGCAKNEYDSQMLAASLVERGCSIVFEPAEADIIIVNTCGFIEDAKKRFNEKYGHEPKVYDVVIGDGSRKLC